VIAIIGGGISGLALAHFLRTRGAEHVVLEASPLPGGVMRTEHVDGTPLDLGPQRTRMTPGVREIVESAGLASEVLTSPPRLPLWVYRRGRLRLVPLTLAGAFRSDLIGPLGKLRVLGEPFTAGLRPHESVATFFTRKFGREAYDSMIGPLYGGLYASDPARMMTRHGLTQTLEELKIEGSLLLAAARRGLGARESLPTITFKDGLGALPRALAKAVNVRCATPVEALERAGGGWSLRLGGAAAGETLDAEGVVLALPAPRAAGLLERVAPEAAGRLAALRYNPLAVAHLKSDCDLVGLGYQVAFGERLETRGVTWNASMFGRTGVFTAYLGGMKNPTVVDWDDARIGDVASHEFEVATGFGARPLLVSRTAVPAWDETWDALDGLTFPDGLHVCASWIARPGIPGRIAQAKQLAARLTGKPA
jgi:protoporphyrinogen/coproporphyrinogen III oxidase